MKKNFLIMMIMVLCAGFTFAQNHNTVRGFVPGAAGNQTYAVFGQMFGDIDFGANPYQAAEGLAQAQIVGDTLETVVGCGDSLTIGEFKLTVADVQKIVDEFADDGPRDTFLTIQHPNSAIYNYDQLLVLHLFVCPCTVDDADGNPYEVIAIDNTHCWTKSNMRTTTNCAGEDVETMSYTSEIVSSLNVDTFGLLYKWNQAVGSDCDSIYKTGICPCGWHLPTAAETALILAKNTDDLRSAEGDYWVVAENITNLTKFSAQPSGYYKGLAERFEGYHSEADFWFADNDSTCKPNYFQILYYCDKPKQEPRNDTADAMSVRCVLDMLYDYHKDDPTPNPTPIPTPPPTTDCPTIGTVSNVGDLGYYFAVNNYDASKISNVTVHYEAVYGVPTNAEQTVTLQGDASVNGQTVIFENTGNNPQYSWFYNEEQALENNPGVSIVDMELVAINTTATILYDGQICTGSDYKDIPVELMPEYEEPACTITDITAQFFYSATTTSNIPNGVSGTVIGYTVGQISDAVTIEYVTFIDGQSTSYFKSAGINADGTYVWNADDYFVQAFGSVTSVKVSTPESATCDEFSTIINVQQ